MNTSTNFKIIAVGCAAISLVAALMLGIKIFYTDTEIDRSDWVTKSKTYKRIMHLPNDPIYGSAEYFRSKRYKKDGILYMGKEEVEAWNRWSTNTDGTIRKPNE